MKHLFTFLSLLSLSYSPVWGQLNSNHNYYRSGDVLIKQQVEFMEPGKAGSNIIWDFSKVKPVNDEYVLSYSLPPIEDDSVYILGKKRFPAKGVAQDELIIGTEHHTMYYYRQIDGMLLQYGHENPSVELEYTQPLALMHYPLNYGNSRSVSYLSHGLYSGSVSQQVKGQLTTTADAYGKLILPSGDTLNPVLRVRTLQIINDISNQYTSSDNSDANKGRTLETYKWYSKGYRYPVFETIRSINIADSTEIFSTAFYYPPQDHLYLDTDPDNLALLEELWEMDKENKNENRQEDKQTNTVNVDDVLECRLYPNPVESFLTLDYTVKKNAKISFQIYSLDGNLIRKTNPKSLNTGSYSETIDCTGMQPKNYVLRVTVNDMFVNRIIIKK